MGIPAHEHPWHQYHWHSPIIPLENVAERQVVSLAPAMVLGGYITLRLRGKYSMQEAHDSLYYTSIRSVMAWGVPVGAVPSRLLGQQWLQYAMGYPGCQALLQLYLREENALGAQEGDREVALPPLEAVWELLHLRTHGWVRYWQHKHEQTTRTATFLQGKEHTSAAMTAGALPFDARDESFVDSLCAVTGLQGLVPYFLAMLKRDIPLSEAESLALLQTRLRPHAREFYQRNVLFCSMRVGDALVLTNPQLACNVYLGAACYDRVIVVAGQQGQLEIIQSFWRDASFAHTFVPTLCEMTRHCGVLTACQAATFLCRTLPREGTQAVCRWIREQLQRAPYHVTEMALSPDAGLREVVAWLQWYVGQEHPTHYHHAPHPHHPRATHHTPPPPSPPESESHSESESESEPEPSGDDIEEEDEDSLDLDYPPTPDID